MATNGMEETGVLETDAVLVRSDAPGRLECDRGD